MLVEEMAHIVTLGNVKNTGKFHEECFRSTNQNSFNLHHRLTDSVPRGLFSKLRHIRLKILLKFRSLKFTS